MAKQNIIILTKNKEIYNKFSNLIFVPEVLIDNSKIEQFRLNKILNNVNKRSKNGEVLKKEVLDNYTVIKRIGPVDFSIYLKS